MEPETIFRHAVAQHRLGRLDEAVAGYRAVLAAQPDLVIARDNLCQALLAAGDYREGFSLYDVRFEREGKRVERPTLSFPEWRGEPLDGRSLLVWPEQGYGDQIMLARFAVQAALRQGARVTLLAPPALVELFRRNLPIAAAIEVIAAAGDVQIPRHDAWAMAGSLPGRLGVAEPGDQPYLAGMPPAQAASASGIGVVWKGDPRYHADAERSMPDDVGRRLLDLPGAVCLHPEATGVADFAQTADIIRDLRAVVTTDTSVAHLAGAMGKPTTILLAPLPDWRWGFEGSASAWYASVRLIRRRAGEPWTDVIERLLAHPPPAGRP